MALSLQLSRMISLMMLSAHCSHVRSECETESLRPILLPIVGKLTGDFPGSSACVLNGSLNLRDDLPSCLAPCGSTNISMHRCMTFTAYRHRSMRHVLEALRLSLVLIQKYLKHLIHLRRILSLGQEGEVTGSSRMVLLSLSSRN
jgi:hypothetical protein